MKTRIFSTILILATAATAAFAHTGVKDPQVLARMHLMLLVSEDMKALGGIAKGQVPFNANAVHQRSNSLANHASEIETLFGPAATDPKSESKDTIWSDWEGFVAKATDMERAAQALGVVKTNQEFETAFRSLGQTCSACHEGYRINTN